MTLYTYNAYCLGMTYVKSIIKLPGVAEVRVRVKVGFRYSFTEVRVRVKVRFRPGVSNCHSAGRMRPAKRSVAARDGPPKMI